MYRRICPDPQRVVVNLDGGRNVKRLVRRKAILAHDMNTVMDNIIGVVYIIWLLFCFAFFWDGDCLWNME